MLSELKSIIFEKYDPSERKGVFFSAYDESGNLLFSKGVIYTDKPLNDLLDSLYTLVDKASGSVKVLVLDLVGTIVESSPDDIFSSDPRKYGFCLLGVDGDVFGMILPDIEGVADAKNALSMIKSKYNVGGKVKLYKFTCDRFVISN